MSDKSVFKITENGQTAMLCGSIDSASSADIIRWIIEQNVKKKNDYLRLVINSIGGSVYDAFAIIATMESSSIPVRTRGDGAVMSAALDVFIAGESGHRFLSKSAMLMSHQAWTECSGRDLEFKAAMEKRNLVTNLFLRHYENHLNLSRGQIEKELIGDVDKYMDADKALELGLCDGVIDHKGFVYRRAANVK